MSDPRFDVRYGPNGVDLDYHFCREWDSEGGCYGTNPDHGFTWDEAKAQIIAHYEGMTEYWRKMTYDEWSGHTTPDRENDAHE